MSEDSDLAPDSAAEVVIVELEEARDIGSPVTFDPRDGYYDGDLDFRVVEKEVTPAPKAVVILSAPDTAEPPSSETTTDSESSAVKVNLVRAEKVPSSGSALLDD